MRFSERLGYTELKEMQVEELDKETRTRLHNILKRRIYFSTGGTKLYMLIADEFFKIPTGMRSEDYNNEIIDLFANKEWFRVLDFIEWYSEYADRVQSGQFKMSFEREINQVLKKEVVGYRLINRMIIPITNTEEIESINASINSRFNVVNEHMKKALNFYGDRTNPDYENSIKESISAVEAMVKIITGDDGLSLGDAIKKLENNGVQIHGAMKKGFIQLYGYTSDSNGIRHAGIDFKKAPQEDAKFMLISCSAFVNYLIEKYSK